MHLIRLDCPTTTLILAVTQGAPPSLTYFGNRLHDNVTPEEVVALGTSQGGPGNPDVAITASLAMELGLGLLGPSGFSAHRDGMDWASRFDVVSAAQDGQRATIHCADPRTHLALVYVFELDAHTCALTISSTLTNRGGASLDLGGPDSRHPALHSRRLHDHSRRFHPDRRHDRRRRGKRGNVARRSGHFHARHPDGQQ